MATSLHLSLLLISLTVLKCSDADCGFPAIPNNADIENIENVNDYRENTTILYRCKNNNDRILSTSSSEIANHDPFISYMRTCSKGIWAEPPPLCAKDVSDSVPIIDLKIGEVGKSNPEIVLSPKRAANRGVGRYQIRRNCIRLNTLGPTEWKFRFANESLVTYFELDLRYDDLISQEVRQLQSKLVSVTSSQFRECKQIHSSHKTRFTENGVQGSLRPLLDSGSPHRPGPVAYYVNILGFLCSMRPEFEEGPFVRYYTTEMTVRFNIAQSFSVCGLRLYQPPPLRCGRPESIFAGKVAIVSDTHNVDEEIKTGRDLPRWSYRASYTCNHGYQLVSLTGSKGNASLVCSPDSSWVGELPQCKPLSPCDLAFDRAELASRGLTYDIKDSVYFNRTKMAIKDTTIVYGCLDTASNRTQLVGEQARVCRADGQWKTSEPVCGDADHLLTRGFPVAPTLHPVIVILIITLIIGAILVLVIFVYFFNKVKTNAAKVANEEYHLRKNYSMSIPNITIDKDYEAIYDECNLDPTYASIDDMPDIIKFNRGGHLANLGHGRATSDEHVYDDGSELYESIFTVSSSTNHI
ncbi:hypothetical protein HDE_01262 [Halotydeus destructor]|nr:hypothetical protein HDE_01262 [Halotydeus destructor]